jgi:hypothetical protein
MAVKLAPEAGANILLAPAQMAVKTRQLYKP